MLDAGLRSASRTGKLIDNRDLGADGMFGTADDVEIGGMATWKVVKAQARDFLGINLTDADVTTCRCWRPTPTATSSRGPNGFAQVVMTPAPTALSAPRTMAQLVEGNPAAPISLDAAGTARRAPATSS